MSCVIGCSSPSRDWLECPERRPGELQIARSRPRQLPSLLLAARSTRDPDQPLLGDEDAIAQILVNLLSNAEKYAGAQKEVELHSYIDGQTVCVSVLDRGLGVPAGEEGKIFEAFYRAHDSLSSGIQGSGLGLTLAQRHAGEHGGEILCQSRSGGGSIFTLRLPLAGPVSPTIP